MIEAKLVLLLFEALFAEGGVFSTAAPQIPFLYWLALGLLVVGEWLAWRGQYLTGSLAMFLGGLGTLPGGLPAFIACLASRRLGKRLIAQDASKISCSHCGYDLRGAPLPRCPECGCLRGFDKTAEELGIEILTRSTKAEAKKGGSLPVEED